MIGPEARCVRGFYPGPIFVAKSSERNLTPSSRAILDAHGAPTRRLLNHVMTESNGDIASTTMKPWEDFLGEFEQDLVLEMSDGSGSVSVNRHVVATYSTLVRSCPNLEEPIPITVSSMDSLEILLRVMYANALPRVQYSFTYDVFEVVHKVYDLIVFMDCPKIVEHMRKEMELVMKEFKNDSKLWFVDGKVLNGLKPVILKEFDALLTLESVSRDLWTEATFTLIYRCVHYGGPRGTYSYAHVARLSPHVMSKILHVTQNCHQNCGIP